MNLLKPIQNRKELSTMKWEYEKSRTGFDDILSFGTADMDFKSPQPILDKIIKIANTGHLGYPFIRDSYYQSISNYLEKLCGWKIDAKSSVANNVGIYTSIFNVIDALTDENDEVIIQTPVHFCFTQMLKDNNRTVIENPLVNKNNRYEIDFEHLESLFTKNTKLFWLCNPHNPVGRAWTKKELTRIGQLCLKYNVKILSDDVYCGLTFKDKKYIPIASISKEISNITITCYSTSKIYNTTGIKFSYIVCENPKLLAKYNQSLQKLDLTYGFNLIGLEITECAYYKCDEWLDELLDCVSENFKILKKYLNNTNPNINIIDNDATYFAWLDLRYLNKSSDYIVKYLEQKYHIILGTGSNLGSGGDGYIRINLATTSKILIEGLNRFSKGILELEKTNI